MATTTLIFPAILLANALSSVTTPSFNMKDWITPIPTWGGQLALKIENAPFAVQSGLTLNILALRQREKEWVGRWPALQFMRDGTTYGHIRMRANVNVQTEGEKSLSAGIKLTF